MSQPKVYEFAKEIGMETIALMDKIREWKLPVKSHMAALDDGTMEEIKKRLEEPADDGAKKKTKKKVAKKKVAAKKTVAKKTDAKKVTKKKVTKKKTVVKKSSAGTAVTKKAVTKKTAAKTVIRRKAGMTAAEKSAEDVAAQMAAAIDEVSAPQEVVTPPPTALETSVEIQEAQNVAQASSAAAKEAPAEKVVRKPKNIVGRMDLRRVTQGSQGGSGKPTTTTTEADRQQGRPGAQRSLRTGFVGPDPFDSGPVDTESRFAREKKEVPKKQPKAAGGGGKEQPVQNFSATEFRKREVIFQPKKKKIQTGQSKKNLITTPKASKRVVEVHFGAHPAGNFD